MLQKLLITINIAILYSVTSSAQIIMGDTVGLREEITNILVSRGFGVKTQPQSQALFNLAIINTENQMGGQNAFSITNNIGIDPPDSSNVTWQRGCIDNEECLIVFPKKGAWLMPYLVTFDSTDLNFKFVPATLGGYEKGITDEGDTVVLKKLMSLSPGSVSNAIVIGPLGTTCFFFGDYSAPSRNYHYSPDGEVFWTESEKFKEHQQREKAIYLNFIKEYPFRPLMPKNIN